MKYEMIFGDQSLFDGAPDGAEMVGGLSYKCRLFYKIVGGDLYASFGTHDNFTKEQTTTPKDIKVSAMRRIIAEPKRWTVEDQKAGRLPEVGWVVTTYDTKRHVFVGESCHENQWSLRDAESGKVYHTPIGDILPIETPTEKAQREEDEFVESTCRQNEPHSTLYSDGVRAAYRKLKGGE